MEPTEETPAHRIATAIKGLGYHALPEVLCTDTIAVGALVPAGKHTTVTRALVDGAEGAIAPYTPERAAGEKCRQPAGALRLLLEAAGVVAQ